MITASSLTRLRQCPSSAVLPRAENASIWADAGNEEHDRLARWVSDRDSDAISDIVDADLLARLPSLVPPGARAELKLAYDVVARTARIIGEGSGRAYGDPGPFEIVGSTDVGGEDGDAVVVIDWKTGFADVEPAATNDQLWFYATALCRACPVRRECAQHALTMQEPYGVWGGLTETDRSEQLFGPRPVRKR